MSHLQFIANQKKYKPFGDKGASLDTQAPGTEEGLFAKDRSASHYDCVVGGLLFKDAESVQTLIAQAKILQEQFTFKGKLSWGRVQARTIEYCRALLSLLFEEDIVLSCVLTQSALAPPLGSCLWWYGLYREALAPCLDKGTAFDLCVDRSFEEYSCGSHACKHGYIIDSPCPAGKKGLSLPKKTSLHLCDLNTFIAHRLALGMQVDVVLADERTQEQLMGPLDILLGAALYAVCEAKGNMAKLELAQTLLSKTEQLKLVYDKADRHKSENAERLSAASGAERLSAAFDAEPVFCDPDAPPSNTKI